MSFASFGLYLNVFDHKQKNATLVENLKRSTFSSHSLLKYTMTMSLSTTLDLKQSATGVLYKPEHLSNFQDEYLTKIFKHFFDRACSVQALADSIEDFETQRKIKIFALHYLSRGSTIPILNESDIIDRSPLDFIFPKYNAAKYYRGDGHPTLKILDQCVQQRFPAIKELAPDEALLVKPGLFTYIAKKACNKKFMGYKNDQVGEYNLT